MRTSKENIVYLWLLLVFLFNGCASYQATEDNIRRVDEAIPDVKPKKIEKTSAPKKEDFDQTKPIPLSVYTGERAADVTVKSNVWYRKVQRWAEIYKKISTYESSRRNFFMSLKYSNIALMWAERAKSIREVNNSDAIIAIYKWKPFSQFPVLPKKPAYFTGFDAYDTWIRSYNILKDIQNPICISAKGVPLIEAIAYLEWSADLIDRRRYTEALNRAQSSYGLVENLNEEGCEDGGRGYEN